MRVITAEAQEAAGQSGAEAELNLALREADAFQSQVLEELQPLRRFSRYLCWDRSEAEDLVQEVVLRALTNRHQFTMGTDLRAWLRAIMRNAFALRGRRREADYDPVKAEKVLATSGDPSITMELEDVRRALTLISPHFREVLILAAGGSSYDEMSFVLGCSLGTVKSRLSRARDELQAILCDGSYRTLGCCSDPVGNIEAQFATLSARSAEGAMGRA
jgi:RNA polymerase sigma-70 factor (ECF subfamily)